MMGLRQRTYRRWRVTVWNCVCLLLASGLMLSLLPARALAQVDPLTHCQSGAFSTEEDFMVSEDKTPFDGDRYISDGDVLSLDGKVCARNSELLAAFYDQGGPDLGLDALDILDITDHIVAFSTEIDHRDGAFTAGDLLFTTGAAVPNIALVAKFDIKHDVGLDAVQLMGESKNIISFVNELANIPRDEFVRNPAKLQDLLAAHKIDIWFSIEGTEGAPGKPTILDGDLLAASGAIIATNTDLLPASVPAGLPTRGVDYGLDAVQTVRTRTATEALVKVTFSVEILFEGQPALTDGDVLYFSDGIMATNADLVNPFAPAADFLGLDALSYRQPQSTPDPMITDIGNYSVWDIDGGFVVPSGPGTGLYAASPGVEPQRPFGWHVPIDGYVPTGIHEFRVVYRKAGTARPAPATADGISTSWRIKEWDGIECQKLPLGTYKDDGSGWFKYSEYQQHRYNDLFCPDVGIVLAVWDTLNDLSDAANDEHYVLWLQWRVTSGGPILEEPADHHIQLDNTAPEIDKLELRTKADTTVPPCADTADGEDEFKVYGEFSDAYFDGYRLRLRGEPPAQQYYPSPAPYPNNYHNYWDGTPEVANIDSTGTISTGVQYLRNIDLNDLGSAYKDCCYALDLWVRDRSIRHNFYGWTAYPQQPSWAWPNTWITFAAAPAP